MLLFKKERQTTTKNCTAVRKRIVLNKLTQSGKAEIVNLSINF